MLTTNYQLALAECLNKRLKLIQYYYGVCLVVKNDNEADAFLRTIVKTMHGECLWDKLAELAKAEDAQRLF